MYDTFVIDQMVLRPPDENALNDLEMILHNSSALEYFYGFLKTQDERERGFLFFNADEGVTPRKSNLVQEDTSLYVDFDAQQEKKPS